jgi:hypothetical protein
MMTGPFNLVLREIQAKFKMVQLCRVGNAIGEG